MTSARTYTGHVEPGGPPEIRELARLRVSKLSVGGAWDNNVYLLRCTETGAQLLVDAADEAPRVLAMVGDAGLERVVTTHRHQDHWKALAAVVAATGARTAAGRDDIDGIPVATDEPLADGDEIRLGRCILRVITLVGHTPGSVALRYDEPGGVPHLWTGDSLFPGGPGKTAGPVEFTSLMDDLEQKVFGPMPDQTWVYPGHGDDTTLGVERPSVPTWRARGW
jgi:glyoxylase-like metal-dependent hydrolase (beta-lactamase superfamily II)